MNAIALAVATGCVGWRDSAGAGGKEPAGYRAVISDSVFRQTTSPLTVLAIRIEYSHF